MTNEKLNIALTILNVLFAAASVFAAVVSIRISRSQTILPFRIKALQNKIRGKRFFDPALNNGGILKFWDNQDLDNLETVSALIKSAEKRVQNQNVPPGYRRKTQEQKDVEDFKELKRFLEKQAGIKPANKTDEKETK